LRTARQKSASGLNGAIGQIAPTNVTEQANDSEATTEPIVKRTTHKMIVAHVLIADVK